MIRNLYPYLLGSNYDYYLIVLDGQSNNGGQGETSALPSYLTGPITGANIYTGSSFATLEVGVNHTGQAIESSGNVWRLTWHGSELELAYRMTQQYNVPIYIVKCGQGGRGLAPDGGEEDFYPDTVGELHDDMVGYVNAAKLLIPEGNGLMVYSYMQGEDDALTIAKSDAYEANLTYKMAQVRADIGVEKVIIHQIPSYSAFGPYTSTIRSAQLSVATADSNIILNDTSAYSNVGDDVHFNSAGQIAKGLAEFNIIKQL